MLVLLKNVSMFHQHKEIEIGNEICCSTCGQVLGTVQESLIVSSKSHSNFNAPGLEQLMLGTSFNKIGFWQSPENKDLKNKERVGLKLLEICREFHISDDIAYETMRKMLKENRGFYSSHKQIKMLCNVLKNSENVKYILSIGNIVEKYDKITGI